MKHVLKVSTSDAFFTELFLVPSLVKEAEAKYKKSCRIITAEQPEMESS